MLEESLELSVSITRADRLPKNIRTALQRLNALPCSELHALKPKERVTLSFLVRCTSYSSQGTPIRVRKNVLANQIGVSVRTLYRILNTLSGLGLITRHEQQIDRRAGAQVSEISWAPWFSNVLFDCNTAKSQPRPEATVGAPELNAHEPSCSAVSVPNNNAKLAHACRYSQLSIRQSQRDSDQRSVPEDCRDLLVWMNARAIFKLMGAFSASKRKLGDFVSGHYEHIKRASNRFSYLYAIARNPHAAQKQGEPIVQRGDLNRRHSSHTPSVARVQPIVGIKVVSGESTFVCAAKGLIEVYFGGVRKGSVSWDKARGQFSSEVIDKLCALA